MKTPRDTAMADSYKLGFEDGKAYGQACIDTLTRPADGEFHECPHCKGWSRTSAQQPAEAVAWWEVRRETDPSFPRVFRTEAEADRLIAWVNVNPAPTKHALYHAPPPAIDIGKLRELETAAKQALELLDRPEVAKALHGLGFLNTRAALREAVAAAPIGDGGRAQA